MIGDVFSYHIDIEPDRNDKPADIKALPRRTCFYHGKIAARSLNSGAGYDDLKNVVIIMIMPYDPFGQNRMVYTIKNKCVEQLLHYMENSTYENAVNEELRKIHRMVETVKRDPEVGGMRIQILEENYELKQEVTRQAEENKRQAEEIKRQTEENKRQTEEIKRLREELNRKNGEA